MAKVIKYNFLSAEINHGTKENPDMEQIFLDKSIICPAEAILEANLPIAKREAYNGEYTVEDDGQPEPEATPTEAERIAELEEAMDMILSGVTE